MLTYCLPPTDFFTLFLPDLIQDISKIEYMKHNLIVKRDINLANAIFISF